MAIGILGRRRRDHRLNIIGISYGYHDSACALLQDGRLVAAAQEERFTRVKNDKSFPRNALRYCLREAGLSIADVDHLAYYEDPVRKLGRQMWMGLVSGVGPETVGNILDRAARPSVEDGIRSTTGFDGPIDIVDHHLSHAASSYFYSGFDEAAILTIDAVGDWPTTTYGSGSGHHLDRFEQVDFPDSLGFLYSAITGYLGFEVNEGEYKVMGLAPYGEPWYADRMGRLIESGPDGQFRLDMRYFGFLAGDAMFSHELVDLLGHPPRPPESELTQFHRDVAASIQVVLEEIMLDKVRYLHRKVPSANLCMAGGVALNVVANSRCLREGPFERLFVQPAAGDAGGSIGAAAVAHTRVTGQRPDHRMLRHVYLGPANPVPEIHRLLNDIGAPYLDFRDREPELLAHVAGRLAEGDVVGWVHGRMEFGPRALGARSILADPRGAGTRDRINELIKMREAFRPFAPAVLETEASRHFELDHPSPFMLETHQVISPIDLPSVTHVDGSARVQTVEEETNPRFAALLTEFHRRTGCPILLNTSFNVRGEPIVRTSLDAIRCFAKSRIDLLVLEDFVLDRTAVAPLWELEAEMSDPHILVTTGETVDHTVYTLF
jgi:carbamoyltransferase